MYDYGLSTLTQYGITAQSASRTRGALVCRTDQGLLILKQFHGSEKKLQFQQELLQKLAKEGCQVDTFLENQTGSLITKDKDNIPYTIQNWFEGRECDTKSREDIFRSVQMLAKLHKSMKMPVEEAYVERSLEEEYQKHNCEIRKIRKFIRKKGASALFEKEFLGSVQWFLEKGEKALNLLQQSDYAALREEALKEGCVCHGEYNQHNVFFRRDGTAAANFGHFCFDIQISDLYCFMRKILEKHGWSERAAERILNAYSARRPLDEGEIETLRLYLSYPWKYWKLANRYYGSRKSWISGRNTEKLKTLNAQQADWLRFVKGSFF